MIYLIILLILISVIVRKIYREFLFSEKRKRRRDYYRHEYL
jgi:hypothetical protein